MAALPVLPPCPPGSSCSASTLSAHASSVTFVASSAARARMPISSSLMRRSSPAIASSVRKSGIDGLDGVGRDDYAPEDSQDVDPLMGQAEPTGVGQEVLPGGHRVGRANEP